MMEKRRKGASLEEGVHMDVQDYEVKKVTYRHRWAYFLGVALLLVFVCVQSSKPKVSTEVKTGFDLVPKANAGVAVAVAKAKAEVGAGAGADAGAVASLRAGAGLVVDAAQLALKLEEVKKAAAVNPLLTPLQQLHLNVTAEIEGVRRLKQHVVMESDPQALAATLTLQAHLRDLLRMEYGDEPYRVEMKVQFPKSMESPGQTQEASLMIDLAPIDMVPYSVYYFLQIVKGFKKGAFHRNAGHVLQSQIRTLDTMQSLAWQVSPFVPH
jgi:hypothetical protein